MSIEPMEVRDGVAVINVCDLYDALNLWEADWDTSSSAVMGWCESNGASYYARCREDFFTFQAVEQAKAEGKTSVVVEDLS